MNYTQFLYLDGRNLLYRFKLYRHVLLDKKNNTFNSKLIRDTAQAVKNTNTSIALAPEGQRRRKESIGDGQLQEKFKTGGFQMSLDSNSPITPVVLFGAYELLPPDKIFPNPGTVTIRFLPQIEPQKGDTVETLQQKVREAMIYSLKNPPPRTRVHQQKSSPLLFFLMLGLWGFILHSIAANFFLW